MLEKFREPVDLDSLCFGRIDIDGGRTLYLGRGALYDDDSNLLVVNWRRPAVAGFYTASQADPQGLALRRRFQLDQLRLLGIVDDVFVESATADDGTEGVVSGDGESAASPIEPHIVDAILADMDRARGTEMREIVATIEAQQYKLISDSIDGLLVIQGAPGSGKTAIALHRAAWLLFNHRDELEQQGVLVVGPNRAFMEYVAAVLPSLGETAVVQAAIDRLADIREVRVRATDDTAVARLKGDIRMASIVQRAVRARVRVPTDDVVIPVGRTRIALSSGDVVALVEQAWRADPTYLGAREAFRRSFVAAAQRQTGDGGGLFRSGPTAGDVEMAITGTGGPFERIWPTVTSPEVIRDLFNSRQRLSAAASGSLSDDEEALLRRDRARLIREEPWTSADVPLLDEAEEAIRGVTSVYGYVLADEAQDLTPMQLRMVLRRSASGRATLVGDIAQATGPIRFRDWTELFDATAVDGEPRIAELAIGYRVPRQIMDLAAQLLPRVAPEVMVPRAVREGPEEPELVRLEQTELAPALVEHVSRRLDGERSVGVITSADGLEDTRAALNAAGLQAGDVLTDGLARQITVLTAPQAKGLEFDHVIVVEPADIAVADDGWALVYIALTRSTRTLSVLHTTPDPFEIPPPPAMPEPPVAAEPSEPAEVPEVPEVPEVLSSPAGTVLGARYTEALMQAKFLHANQQRRGTSVPYFAHLQAVAALVLEDGGTEDEAIAALLHDAVEDYGANSNLLERIVDQFGMNVGRIVIGCTDPDVDEGASWRDRKVEHLRELESAGPEVRRVALAEKLDNARAMLRDYRRVGDRLWTRMGVDPDELLWYVSELADLFVTERPGDMAWEFQRTVETLLDLASAPDGDQEFETTTPAATSR